MSQNKVINVDFGNVDYSPAIIDFDFKKNRPRGGSSRIDFFSQGILSSSLDNVALEKNIYLKKTGTFFEKGVFIVDFKECISNPKIVTNMLKDLNVSKVYVEKSKEFDISPILETLNNLEIIYLTFSSSK